MKLQFTNNQRTGLQTWYRQNQRPLPWRKSKNPYKIWISETMLQQTTVSAVIPYFHRFMSSFPTLRSLAHAKEAEVIQAWSGLGYYSRARNIHRAAQLFHDNNGLPSTFQELILYPGLGPYTARSVASLAFNQDVGVLDGNVIRVLCRFFHLNFEWWKSSEKKYLQRLADNAVLNFPSDQINQALMELGATICTPQSPKCNSCPWQKHCHSYELSDQLTLPIKKPRRSKETWLWTPHLINKSNRFALCKNSYTPFLKNQWILPGVIEKLKEPPDQFDFRHTITHYNIFVKIPKSVSALNNRYSSTDIEWVEPNNISLWTPSSLIKKVFEHEGLA